MYFESLKPKSKNFVTPLWNAFKIALKISNVPLETRHGIFWKMVQTIDISSVFVDEKGALHPSLSKNLFK